MKIFLLGATGKTGSLVLKGAIDRGHTVTAYVRNPSKIIMDANEKLDVIIGDLSFDELSFAMIGHDVVISCLGGNDNDKDTVISNMTKVIVDCMKTNDIKRIVAISSAGIHDEFNLITNIILKVFYKYVIHDHKLAAEYIMTSNLDYTLARPLSLTEGELTRQYRKTTSGVPKGGKNISREDLSHFLLEVTEKNNYIKETVGLAYYDGGKMFTIIQFSPTGNTAHIADLLSNHLGTDQVYALEHTSPSDLPSTSHIIVLYAIHAFNAPKTVKRFVSNMPVNKFNKVSLIGVGCNDSWLNYAASKDIRYMLEAKHYPVVVDEIIAMPLTFIMSFPEEVIQSQIAEAHNKIKKLSFDIKECVVSQNDLIFKSRLVHWIGRVEPFAARFFGLELHSTKRCIKCGLCIKECPEHNIRMKENGKLKFGMKCMMCMRCIYNCPTKAIVPRISKFIPIKNGYSIEKHLEERL